MKTPSATIDSTRARCSVVAAPHRAPASDSGGAKSSTVAHTTASTATVTVVRRLPRSPASAIWNTRKPAKGLLSPPVSQRIAASSSRSPTIW